MKSILLAAFAAIAATTAPLQAAAKSYVVKHVEILTLNGKVPKGTPVFKKGQTVKLNITKKKLTGPKKINMPIQSKSVTADVYFKAISTLKYQVGTVRKNTTNKKVIGVELSFFGPTATPVSGVTAPGQVTYILVPKKKK